MKRIRGRGKGRVWHYKEVAPDMRGSRLFGNIRQRNS